MLFIVKRRKEMDTVMIKFFWTRTQHKELENVFNKYRFPTEVQSVILNTIGIMDGCYGEGREMDAEGGYIAILIPDEKTDIQMEYQKILDKYHMSKEWCEFNDKLCSDKTGTYYSDLYIASSEFLITIIWIDKEGAKE